MYDTEPQQLCTQSILLSSNQLNIKPGKISNKAAKFHANIVQQWGSSKITSFALKTNVITWLPKAQINDAEIKAHIFTNHNIHYKIF